MKHLRILFIIALLAAACVAPSTAQDEAGEDLRFFLSFIPNIQFAPYYVAAAQGYFAEAGFDISFEHGDENIGLEQIAVGDLSFGAISGEQVVLARANDRPVVYVYEWFQEYPIGLVIPDTTEATTVAELAGQRVGVPGRFGATYIGLTALLLSSGLQEIDVQLESIGFVAPDVVCAGGVEASAIYLNNEPLQIQRRADAGECGEVTGVSVIPVSSVADLVSNGIVTNETVLAETPETVAAVVSAFDRGLRDSINNPAQAYLLSRDFVEGLPASDAFVAALEAASDAQIAFLETEPARDAIAASRAELLAVLREIFSPDELLQFEVLLATIDLWEAEQLGLSTPESWAAMQDVLLSMGLLSAPIDIEAAYTNDFLPAAAE
jgi:NitT/TauT family transport system substrate-binding protein